jgi:hypothetical protein
MKAKIGFLEESEGVRSSARLIFVFGSYWNMALCSYLALTGNEPGTVIATFSAIEGVLLGIKLGQKNMETKIENHGA